MKKILAFGASNSSQSINKQLAIFAANQLQDCDVNVVDLNDYASPLYSIDLERKQGVDRKAVEFYELIKASDAIVVSLAEYNGLHTAAFKNLWDWLSRIPTEKPMNFWDGKPMFLLSTSPSRRAQSNVMKVSKELFPFFGAQIISDFQLPSFNHYFKDGEIVETSYKAAFELQKEKFQTHLDSI